MASSGKRSSKASVEEPEEGTTEEESTETPEEEAAEPADPATGPVSDPSKTPEEALDPALVDPVAFAQEQHAGTVNDASHRLALLDEGVAVSGDVDAATVPDTAVTEPEWYPPLSAEDWVVLKAGAGVPDSLVGHRAVVLDAPNEWIQAGSEDSVYLTVRTRDDKNATLVVPLTSVDVDRGGRQFVHG